MTEPTQVHPKPKLPVVLLNGRNFVWAAEVTGYPVSLLETKYLEDKAAGILSTVTALKTIDEHLHIYKYNENLEMMVCDCGKPPPSVNNKPVWR